jgi:hypothetical protein
VHSMVEFADGSTIAQASPPDMRLPIALGLGWPDRVPDARPAATGRRRPPGSSCRSTTRRSPPYGWLVAPASPAARPRGAQRRQRGVRRGIPRRRLAFPVIFRHIARFSTSTSRRPLRAWEPPVPGRCCLCRDLGRVNAPSPHFWELSRMTFWFGVLLFALGILVSSACTRRPPADRQVLRHEGRRSTSPASARRCGRSGAARPSTA